MRQPAAYYNENDPKTAAWLRELIKAGLIADGEVDTRSIVDVQPSDLAGFVQCHFFAGIGGWSYALRLAGWPDDRAVWTGSCPCQPWSMAGEGQGTDDPRHLWPTWFSLIKQCLPPTIFGEQVASLDGLYWLDLVYVDLEATGYALGAVDLAAASVGAPHIRQRLWFMANTARPERRPHAEGRRDVIDGCDTERSEANGGRAVDSQVGELADAGHWNGATRPAREQHEAGASIGARPSGYGEISDPGGRLVQPAKDAPVVFWRDLDWLECSDGKSRPVEPGTFPLAHGLPARVGRLRGYGNAIVPQVAAEVIVAYMDIREATSPARGDQADRPCNASDTEAL